MLFHARRLLAALLGAGFALAVLAVYVASPSSAQPNCNLPVPPPICKPTTPPTWTPRYPDLQVTLSGPRSADAGTTATYGVTVTNPRALYSAAAGGVRVSAAVGGGGIVTGVSGTSGFSCTSTAVSATCTNGSIGVGGTATINLTVALPNAAATVTASATADPSNAITERDETNNSASASTTVSVPPRPDLVMAMTGPGSVVGGQEHSGPWTMTITNRGTATATGFSVEWLSNWRGTVDWPPDMVAPQTGPMTFACSPPAEYMQETINCHYTGGALAPGATETITLYVTPPPANGRADQWPVTATVDYLQEVVESNESNNAATVIAAIT